MLTTVLISAAAVGCGREDVRQLAAPPPATPAAQPPAPTPSAAAPGASPTPEPTGSPGSSSSPGSPGAPGSAGPGGTGPTRAAASGGAPSGAPGGQSGSPSASGEDELPTPQASPVFLGEACDPGADTRAIAINGLVLYCGASSDGGYRWSPNPGGSPSPTGARPGSECDPNQANTVTEGTNGRPFACLREPDGTFRWSDVS